MTDMSSFCPDCGLFDCRTKKATDELAAAQSKLEALTQAAASAELRAKTWKSEYEREAKAAREGRVEVSRLRARLRELGGWIPCSERMPPEQEPVIVFGVFDYGEPAVFEALCMPSLAIAHRWQFRGGRYCHESEVTHWRPMPRPPEGE